MKRKKVNSTIANAKRTVTNVIDKVSDSEYFPVATYAVGIGLGVAAGYFLGKAKGVKMVQAQYIEWFKTYKDAYFYTGNGVDITTKLSESGVPAICLHAQNLLLEPKVVELEAPKETVKDLAKQITELCEVK